MEQNRKILLRSVNMPRLVIMLLTVSVECIIRLLALLGSKTIFFLCAHPQKYMVLEPIINTSHHILWERAYKIMVLEPKSAKTPNLHSTVKVAVATGLEQTNHPNIPFTSTKADGANWRKQLQLKFRL